MFPTQLSGYVIVGGGLCGCVLAHELSLRTDRDIWIIEAGGEQPENLTNRSRPGRWLHLLGSTDDESFPTLANERMAGRQIAWPRGRGLGGSGRINAMIWVPPHEKDIESLVSVGLDRDLLRSSNQRAQEIVASETPHYLSDSAQQVLLGLNGQTDLGDFQAYQRINQSGRRWTAEGLIRSEDESCPKQIRVLNASVSRLVQSEGRVTSLELTTFELTPYELTPYELTPSSHSSRVELSKDARLICCAGALGTPRLLMQSGIGFEQLGNNLHDHLIMPVVFQRSGDPFLPEPPTMQELSTWQHTGGGPLASNIAECGGFDPECRFQWHITPTDYLRYPSPKAGPAMTLGVSLTRPRSRGSLRLSGDNTSDASRGLAIDNGYLSDQQDLVDLIEGVRRSRHLADQLRDVGMSIKETIPGSRRQTDEQIASSIARYATTLYHPGGTCAIGPVVDDRLGIHGIDNLSVVDASVIPEPTMANPTAVLAMLACYAADVIKI